MTGGYGGAIILALLIAGIFGAIHLFRNGGARVPTLPTSWMGAIPASTTTFVKDHWARLVIPVAAIGFALLAINAIFPRWAEAYATIGGPVSYLLFGMILVGIISAAGLKKTSHALGSVLGAVMVGFLVVALFYVPSCVKGDTVCEKEVAAQEQKKLQDEAKREENLHLAALASAPKGTSELCPGGAIPFWPTQEYLKINSADCRVLLRVKSGKVKVKGYKKDPASKKLRSVEHPTAIGPAGGYVDLIITEIRAVKGEEPEILYGLCDQTTASYDVDWSCRPLALMKVLRAQQ